MTTPLCVVAVDKEHLCQLIKLNMAQFGSACSLNHIDVSNIQDFKTLFNDAYYFVGDISKWDVSNATDMTDMFRNTTFNGDISQWNVANVACMVGMFSYSAFNGSIDAWNVSKVTDAGAMFFRAKFAKDISRWEFPLDVQLDDFFENAHQALAAQTMSPWVLRLHLEDGTFPESAGAQWTKAYASAKGIIESLELSIAEQVAAIYTVYDNENNHQKRNADETPVDNAVFG